MEWETLSKKGWDRMKLDKNNPYLKKLYRMYVERRTESGEKYRNYDDWLLEQQAGAVWKAGGSNEELIQIINKPY